ncbi:MAG: alkaline phosphatase family protein [Alphaproteobacteria bacterium]|nr:alkaline phosphatase family protein [Alphaproteobacteria bacterium]
MAKVRNVLFIMCDQWRADHLGCAGHPHLKTPVLDALAQEGVRFDRAFCNATVCGPSRMSMYTGRSVMSHGATWNRVPLSFAEKTIGDHLKPGGLSACLLGKTHVLPDVEGLNRVGIEGGSAMNALLREGGFVSLDRYDGHSPPGEESGYPAYLRAHGFAGADPWNEWVVSVDTPEGPKSGWNMRHVRHPARIPEAHSETAYMTDRAIRFVEEQGDTPWFLHLSYVKPHWPYVAPAPYHDLYGPQDMLQATRRPQELVDAHPVLAAYRRMEECVNFARDETVATVRPAYMGLIAQLDHHLGRLFTTLKRLGRWGDTLVVFTADHGDHLGDHYLGEKEIFYESALRLPLIVYDPDPAADPTRGRVDARLVEGIDFVPTFLDALGLPIPGHVIEGESLLPLLRGPAPRTWREAAVAELDYSFREARRLLGRGANDCRAIMIRTERWKYVEWIGFRPQLFDLVEDPQEFVDRGADPALENVRREMRDRLVAWFLARKNRRTRTDAEVERMTAAHKAHGVLFGVW